MTHTLAAAEQAITDAGLVPVLVAAPAAGLQLPGDGDILLMVKNASAGSINVTIPTPGQVSGLAIADRVIAVAAGAEALIGQLKPNTYAQPSGAAHPGKVLAEFSAVVTVTYAVLRP